MTATPDHKAAAIHAAKAEEHYAAAARLRKLGLTGAAQNAERAARDEDHIAFILRTGNLPPAMGGVNPHTLDGEVA